MLKGLINQALRRRPGPCFSKVPKLFGSLSVATIPFISSQRRGSKPSNFAILLIFLMLKTCKKISFSKQADCSLTTSFSGPKSSRDFRETGPWALNWASFFMISHKWVLRFYCMPKIQQPALPLVFIINSAWVHAANPCSYKS